MEWNEAWEKTYWEIGGQSEESAKKNCPKNGAKTLYELGRIINSKFEYQDVTPQYVKNNHGKNGVYSKQLIFLVTKKLIVLVKIECLHKYLCRVEISLVAEDNCSNPVIHPA